MAEGLFRRNDGIDNGAFPSYAGETALLVWMCGSNCKLFPSFSLKVLRLFYGGGRKSGRVVGRLFPSLAVAGMGTLHHSGWRTPFYERSLIILLANELKDRCIFYFMYWPAMTKEENGLPRRRNKVWRERGICSNCLMTCCRSRTGRIDSGQYRLKTGCFFSAESRMKGGYLPRVHGSQLAPEVAANRQSITSSI